MVVRSQEWKKKQRLAKFGKPNTALIGRKYPEEHRKAISEALKGRRLSEPHKKAISEANMGKKMSPEAIAKRNLKIIGQKRSLDSRRKMSLSHLGKPGYWKGKRLSEETKRKIREKRLNQILPRQDTSIEIAMQNELRSRHIDFQSHYPFLGQPDIFIAPSLCIFCDGDYWHNYPEGREKDKKITKQLQQEGFEVLRFWEHEIEENIKGCVDKIAGVI